MSKNKGKPTMYLVQYAPITQRLVSRSNADKQTLAWLFGVSGRTLRNWMARHPELKEAVCKGRKEYELLPQNVEGEGRV